MKGWDRIFRDMKEARRNFCNIECWNFWKRRTLRVIFSRDRCRGKAKVNFHTSVFLNYTKWKVDLKPLEYIGTFVLFLKYDFLATFRKGKCLGGRVKVNIHSSVPRPCFPGQHLLLTTEKASLGREFFFHNWLEQYLMKNMIGVKHMWP